MIQSENLDSIVMQKISIVGIDNTGKTSITQSFKNHPLIEVIHLTSIHNGSKFVRIFSSWVSNLAAYGEHKNNRTLTGLAYFLHLIPYAFTARKKRLTQKIILLSDRDPILDTLCYAEMYLPSLLAKNIRALLHFFLVRIFPYPHTYIYLDCSPDISEQRILTHSNRQIHEHTHELSRLQSLFKHHLSLVSRLGISVIRIPTQEQSLECVLQSVQKHIYQILELTNKK